MDPPRAHAEVVHARPGDVRNSAAPAATRQPGCATAALEGQFRAADGIDAVVPAVQEADRVEVRDLLGAETGASKLGERHDVVDRDRARRQAWAVKSVCRTYLAAHAAEA